MSGMGSGMAASPWSPTAAVTASSWVAGGGWVADSPGRFLRETSRTFVTNVKRKIVSQGEVPGTSATDPPPATRAGRDEGGRRPPATTRRRVPVGILACGCSGWSRVVCEPRSGSRAPRARSSPPGTRRVPGSCGVPPGHLDPLVTDGIAGTTNVLSARASPRHAFVSAAW